MYYFYQKLLTATQVMMKGRGNAENAIDYCRFAVKVGLAGTAIYYMKKEGIWNESELSLKALDKLNEASKPHLDQIKAQVPLEVSAVINKNIFELFLSDSSV